MPTTPSTLAERASGSSGPDDDEPRDTGPFTVGGENEELLDREHGYLNFGYDRLSPSLDLVGTVEYLSGHGYDRNPLEQARTGGAGYTAGERDPNGHYCDFCGRPMDGDYDTLKDGRERCPNCSKTAVRTVGEFRTIFQHVMRTMEGLYGIKFTHAVRVEVRDAKAVNEGKGFHPTPKMDFRMLGYAQKDFRGWKVVVENGAPRADLIETLSHELTHIWQYSNWTDSYDASLSETERLEIYEGMATWSGIQFLYYVGEVEEAAIQENLRTNYDDTEYGRGLRRYLARYPMSRSGGLAGDTPFRHIPPLEGSEAASSEDVAR
jgi:hypothetical protein